MANRNTLIGYNAGRNDNRKNVGNSRGGCLAKRQNPPERTQPPGQRACIFFSPGRSLLIFSALLIALLVFHYVKDIPTPLPEEVPNMTSQNVLQCDSIVKTDTIKCKTVEILRFTYGDTTILKQVNVNTGVVSYDTLVTRSRNVAVGYNAGMSASGSQNTIIGYCSGKEVQDD